jgi:triacylglycerol lipase
MTSSEKPSISRHLVDPALQPLLDMMPATEPSLETLPAMRSRSAMFPVNPESAAKVTQAQHTVPGPNGAPNVSVRCYRPKDAAGPLPCIFHIHGGGYIGGSAADMEASHVELSLALGCAIVSVEYRLAPEAPYPAAVEDCYAALAWLFANPAIPGVDTTRVGVMGESAGGGLAAALALLARDRGEYPFVFQHLIYPMLDDRTSAEGASDPHPYAGEYIWTHGANRFGWRSLLGAEPGGADVSPYAAPARATDLAGLPRTFILTGALDLFLEEDMDYARRLTRAGVPVELHVYPGGVHAFDFVPGLPISEQARRDSRESLRAALSGGGH